MTTNEAVHSDLALSAILNDIKQHLGIILVAEAGHGKSYTAFSLVKEAMKDPNMTVIILSPSTIWRRQFGAIQCLKVGTYEFNPIVEIKETTVESVNFLRDAVHINLDKHWSYAKSAWLEELLRSKKSLLFEIKYRNGRRIKAFESVVLQFIYEMQEQQIDQNPEYNHHYLIVLEEIQNSFGTYSMNSDDSLDLMTIFTQSRSDANIHYIGIGQRLNDISTKVIERLRPFIGLTLGENSLRKIKSQLPEELKDRVQQLPKRHWLYLDGKTNPEIVIPDYHKEGKPTMLKPKLAEQPKKLNLLQRFANWYVNAKKQLEANRKSYEQQVQQRLSRNSQTQLSEEDKESQEDGYLDRDEEEDADLIEFGL
ncbi:MAG: ATP-binding protein [Candidatus Bathyarchaeota archaeon]|nr:ATP-binding protein [Candidatus Bathyarchaeota archaeon]